MKNKKLLLLSIILLLSVKISKGGDLDTSGVFMTLDDQIVYMLGDAQLTEATIEYHDGKKKSYQSAKMADMKWMMFGTRAWCAFPVRKGDHRYRLLEIIAMNKKYVLASYYNAADYLYIFDYESKALESNIYTAPAGGVKKHNKNAFDIIQPYFSGCESLISKFEANMEAKKMLCEGVGVEQCDGAPDLNKFLSTYKDKRIDK